MKWLGEKLKDAVKKMNITQAVFADSIGVSRITVSSWFNGQVPKGIELMKICQLLKISPGSLFDNEVSFSRPRHRLTAHAKKTESLDVAADEMLKDYADFFTKDLSFPLSWVINYHAQSEPQKVAAQLRQLIKLQDEIIKLKDVCDLAAKLGIFVVPACFAKELSRTSAFYTLYNNCNKVIFIDVKVCYLDLVYFLLHEICHAVINNRDTDDAEEKFCENVAQIVQFPQNYVAEVHQKITGKTPQAQISILKQLSVKNCHSIYGISKALDCYYRSTLAKSVGGALGNQKKQMPTLKQLLIEAADLSTFIKKFNSLFPLFFTKVVLDSFPELSDRRLCELLCIEDITYAPALRTELARVKNDIGAGCNY